MARLGAGAGQRSVWRALRARCDAFLHRTVYGAELFRLATVHGTPLSIDDLTGRMHHTYRRVDRPLHVLKFGADGLFLARDDGPAAGGADEWRLMPFPARIVERGDGTCTLRNPVTEMYYSAEPIDRTPDPTPIRDDRRHCADWETFALRPVRWFRSRSLRCVCRQMRRVLRTSPSAQQAIVALDTASQPDTRDRTAERCLIMARLTRAELEGLSLDTSARVLKGLASPHDYWLSIGLPSLAEWVPRREPSFVRGLGIELDPIERGYQAPYTAGRIWSSTRRRLVAPTRRACLVATARNEGAYLIEWIAYHRALGFDHVFIYSNDNDDLSDDLLRALARSGVITWIDNTVGPRTRPQLKAYCHAFGLLPDVLDYEWSLVIDLDEFMVVDRGKFDGLGGFLDWQSAEETHAITLNWMIFGTFDAVEFDPEGFVIERFLRRYSDADRHIKTIFRSRHFEHSHCHYPIAVPGTDPVFRDARRDLYRSTEEFAHALVPVAENAWINHYHSKSVEELLLRSHRGAGDQIVTGRRSIAELAAVAYSRVLAGEASLTPVIDARALAFRDATRAEADRILRLPGVSGAAEAVDRTIRARIADLRRQFLDLDRDGSPEHVRVLAGLLEGGSGRAAAG